MPGPRSRPSAVIRFASSGETSSRARYRSRSRWRRPSGRRGVPVQCLPGLSGGDRDRTRLRCPASRRASARRGDGGPLRRVGREHLRSRAAAVSDYSMDQRAALLWYHDHVMGVTRFTVYAGLAGLWIVRDERERALDLPEGPPFEVPLLLQDRNFGEDAEGRLTGELVHKTDPGTMEAFAPFTTVNGKVWPVLDVQPATYRLRVINGSNARTFRLVLLRDGRARTGSDRADRHRRRAACGPRSRCRPRDSCSPRPSAPTCSSTSPTCSREASSPSSTPPPRRSTGHRSRRNVPREAADLDGLLPYPDVMRFRVVPGPSAPSADPARARERLRASDGRRARRRGAPVGRAGRAGARRRPQHADDARARAMAGEDSAEPLITVVDEGDRTIARFRTVAGHFEDTVTFFPISISTRSGSSST